jgi:hypothetical protein
MMIGIKKGELTSTMVVGIILALLAFGVLIAVFYQISWTGVADRETCHQSVVIRGSIPVAAESLVPLKCKTTKNCITSGLFGGKCDDVGEPFYNTKSINKVKVKDTTQIEKFIAMEAVDCWTMMGEGKLSIFSQFWAQTFGIGTVYPSCVICSRIAFDNKLGVEDLDKMNVWKYMDTHKIPDGEISYLNFFSGGKGNAPLTVSSSLKVPVLDEKVVDGTKVLIPPKEDDKGEYTTGVDTINKSKVEDLTLYQKDNPEIAVLFMQISAPDHVGSALNVGKAALGIGGAGGYFFGAGALVKTAKFIGVKGGLITLAAIAIGMTVQQFNVMANRDVAAGYCGDMSVAGDSRNGCSVVRVVNYNLEDISGYCQVIESIP